MKEGRRLILKTFCVVTALAVTILCYAVGPAAAFDYGGVTYSCDVAAGDFWVMDDSEAAGGLSYAFYTNCDFVHATAATEVDCVWRAVIVKMVGEPMPDPPSDDTTPLVSEPVQTVVSSRIYSPPPRLSVTPIRITYVPYTYRLEPGVNIVSIPAGAVGIDGLDVRLENAKDLLAYLGSDAQEAYGVGVDRFRCEMGDSGIECDVAELPGIGSGFFIVMKEARTIEYAIDPGVETFNFELKAGYATYGVPLGSSELATIGDLFDMFPGVWMVLVDVTKRGLVFADRGSMLNHDVQIIGGRGYAIHSLGSDTAELTGVAWQDAVRAAPGVVRQPFAAATTWGAIKTGRSR